MREIFATIAEWLQAGVSCGLATLVESYDSAPSPIGTTIAVDASGRIAGNIGAGCHEPQIAEACFQTLADGEFRMLHVNLTMEDEVAGTAGCGGVLRVAIWKPAADFAQTAAAIATGAHDVTVPLAQSVSFTVPAKRRIVVVGATLLANHIARTAKPLGYFVTVVDPRPSFATPERLREADEIVIEWPDEYLPRVLASVDALLVLSHDPKFDVPALRAALGSGVPYIGLLGSRKSQASRREALRELGVDDAALARIHGPAGLDLGGHTEAQTALSILAHVVAESNGRTGMPLDRSSGPIHSQSSAAVSTSK